MQNPSGIKENRMAKIRYIDEAGEHSGTLTAWEYYGLDKPQKIPYFKWSNTDYEPFKKAIDKKYKTTCTKAWIV